MDAGFATIEVARSRARVLAATRDARAARLKLTPLLGIPAGIVVLAAGDPDEALPEPATLDPDSLVRLAHARRPDVRSDAFRLSEAEVRARLARREAIPDFDLGALISREGGGPATRVGLELGVAIPLWNRNGGEAAAQEAGVRRASYERDARLLEVAAEVAIALQAYVAASEEEAVLADDVLVPARRNQILLETAYREGEMDLPALVLLRNQLLDAELGYWDAWLARRLAFTDLQAATGGREGS